ncbi:MAG: hypothetical protein GY696_27640 [Gammaproteobacteria bacterium]|nr:hypothetical protein [Gammaproteobacteria bacterium]
MTDAAFGGHVGDGFGAVDILVHGDCEVVGDGVLDVVGPQRLAVSAPGSLEYDTWTADDWWIGNFYF